MELSHNLQQLRHSCTHYSSTTQTKGTNLSSGTMDNKPQDFTYQMPEAKSVNPILKGGNILFCKYYLILYCIVLITAMHSRRASPFNEKMMGNLFSSSFFPPIVRFHISNCPPDFTPPIYFSLKLLFSLPPSV